MASAAYRLPAVLDMGAAADLRKYALEQLSLQQALAFDASAVERVGTPGVQCLLGICRSAAEAKLAAQIHTPSGAFLAACETLALSSFLPLTQEAAA
ncbi:MAG: hypothetical protein K2Q01_07915 [Rickettsiales bacterium]|nr:hypothetical protein [Rickettsiales bacterium]